MNELDPPLGLRGPEALGEKTGEPVLLPVPVGVVALRAEGEVVR